MDISVWGRNVSLSPILGVRGESQVMCTHRATLGRDGLWVVMLSPPLPVRPFSAFLPSPTLSTHCCWAPGWTQCHFCVGSLTLCTTTGVQTRKGSVTLEEQDMIGHYD